MGIPAMAFAAVPGDDPSTAVSLALPASTSGNLVDSPGYGDAMFWYTVHLTAGQTLAATITAAPGVDNAWLGSFPVTAHGGMVSSDPISNSVEKIFVMAPWTGDYFLFAEADNLGMYWIDASIVGPLAYSMSPVTAPKTAKKNKAFNVGVVLTPDYDGLSSPIKFVVERRSGSKWKPYKTVTGGLAAGGSATRTPMKASLKLPKGTFRVRARFADAAHPAAKYTGWKTVTVK
jgi:hypothetical protein